jgi:Transmembrane protein of unknown function (DUF3556)
LRVATEERPVVGFLSPKLPRRFDVLFWHLKPRAERIRPLAQHWAAAGFGAPSVINLLYLAKMTGYALAAWSLIRATPGIESLPAAGPWWTQPVVFEKVVVWTLLFEVLGLGCGCGPLTMRFLPPFGGVLYWLRPGTIRLPPWPNRVPLTKGTTRTWLDVLLYLALLAAACWPLLGPVTRVTAGSTGPVLALAPNAIVPLAVLVPLVGLRDKTIFLAARAEVYWVFLFLFFLPVTDLLVGAKVLLVLQWWAAAVAQLNRHFPAVVAVLLSNSPLVPKMIKRRLFARFPEDLRPSKLAVLVARASTLLVMAAPGVLLLSGDQRLISGAVVAMVLFHLVILITLPLGVALEWNIFMIFAVVYLFWAHPVDLLARASNPGLIALLIAPVVTMITVGNLWPRRFSYLLAMRYYTGNWATSMWALWPSAIEKLDRHVVKYCGFPKAQMRTIYGEQVAEVVAHKVFVFRAMQPHGRGLFGLLPRAAGPDHESYFVLDGECVAGVVLGWNFGEGHLHDEQLIAALAERCGFEPGEVRVVLLEAQPLGSDRQEYRLVDGATGVLERGTLRVADLAARQPWQLDDLPRYPAGPISAPPRSTPPTNPWAGPRNPRTNPRNGSHHLHAGARSRP